ncbi:MAG: V-type ATP synthase subunit K [Tissierellia bacterium]|nr:V-type ATP synthase subunit K [Tissierellia bacterium]
MTFSEFLVSHGGVFFGGLGVAFAVMFSGIGSATGLGIVGQAAAGLIIEEPEKFGRTLVFQLLPGTQGLYGFVVGLMIVGQLTIDMPLIQGLYLFAASLPVGFVGWGSAIAQGKAAAAGVTVLAKNEDEQTKGLIYAVMVETYALLAFVMYLIIANAIVF